MTNKKTIREQRLEQEVEQWKETCKIVSDRDVMESIQISLRQIVAGKGISLAQL